MCRVNPKSEPVSYMTSAYECNGALAGTGVPVGTVEGDQTGLIAKDVMFYRRKQTENNWKFF
jgi:hypothetical protein